ncbi:MAG: chorismate synthase [Arcobacteraceae bacterium]|nr:chorismate synthase [Arcobacteraceae bacterium]
MNSFGERFKFTTFGESHGKALGCIVDGVPAGIKIDLDFIQDEMDRRKPGGKYATARKESDTIEILSGVFEGVTTGTSISMVLFNENQKSRDYDNVKDLFRPGHADFTYFHKYGIRDYRGGGRSSARETSARVAAGAIAKLILKELNIEVRGGISAINGIKIPNDKLDFNNSIKSEVYSLNSNYDQKFKDAINTARDSHDSIGGVVALKATNVPAGLGEPIYHKLDSQLANAMMGINAVKALEIGDGISSVSINGSQNNDQISSNGFKTNHSGGILGGISNGDDIDMKIYFKPTPSIFLSQDTIDKNNNELKCELKGRHDPCVATRGSIVAESMMAIVLADMLLLNMSSKISHLKKVYN